MDHLSRDQELFLKQQRNDHEAYMGIVRASISLQEQGSRTQVERKQRDFKEGIEGARIRYFSRVNGLQGSRFNTEQVQGTAVTHKPNKMQEGADHLPIPWRSKRSNQRLRAPRTVPCTSVSVQKG